LVCKTNHRFFLFFWNLTISYPACHTAILFGKRVNSFIIFTSPPSNCPRHLNPNRVSWPQFLYKPHHSNQFFLIHNTQRSIFLSFPVSSVLLASRRFDFELSILKFFVFVNSVAEIYLLRGVLISGFVVLDIKNFVIILIFFFVPVIELLV
jgi:hypothetical protein